ncbi:MAG TPA: hypothetical protein VE981_05490 [Planctomycetota bacterium]|nr:hypothetical protein [Planctomycetota bacterium]
MTKIPAILSATLTVSLMACGGGPKDAVPIGPPLTTPLVTGDHSVAGTVSVFNSTDGLFITATAADGWEFTSSRLAVGLALSCIPHGKSGAPTVSRFLLRKTCVKASNEIKYALPLLVDGGTPLVIALQVDVRRVATGDDGHDCDPDPTQTAWPQGDLFPGSSGAMYVTWTVRDAAPSTLAGQYRTHSQEAWGASQANDATAYLNAHFSGAFPSRVTLGAPERFTCRFTMPQSILTFLPQTGTPAVLFRNSADPTDLANSFAGSTLALALNVGFDDADASFSAGTLPLGDLVVADPASLFYGVTVREVLSMVNQILGDHGDAIGISPADAHEAAVRINANFENGGDQGYLGLP